LPLSAFKETVPPLSAGRLKSGALSPASTLMIPPL
jgi:hypothetical protein